MKNNKRVNFVATFFAASLSFNAYSGSENWDVEYNADTLPHNSCSPDSWVMTLTESQAGAVDMSVSKGLFVIDSTNGDYSDSAYFKKDWNVDPSVGAIVEARVKQDSYVGGTNYWGAYYGATRIRVGDGINDDSLVIGPDKVQLFASKLSYEWPAGESSSDYHIYRIEIDGNDIKVFIDGDLKINGIGRFGEQWWAPLNQIAFGEATGYASSHSTWDYVKYTTTP